MLILAGEKVVGGADAYCAAFYTALGCARAIDFKFAIDLDGEGVES